MAAVIAEFFGIIGVDQTPPTTMAELIPWILCIIVGVALVSAVFGLIGKLAELMLTMWRRL